MEISCPECGRYAVTAVCEPDEDGLAEFHCEDCGHYFVDQVPEEELNARE